MRATCKDLGICEGEDCLHCDDYKVRVRADKQQKYIGHDENNELFECIKVFIGKVIKEKPDWLKEIMDKNDHQR